MEAALLGLFDVAWMQQGHGIGQGMSANMVSDGR
jgi:hypothetical protein